MRNLMSSILLNLKRLIEIQLDTNKKVTDLCVMLYDLNKSNLDLNKTNYQLNKNIEKLEEDIVKVGE